MNEKKKEKERKMTGECNKIVLQKIERKKERKKEKKKRDKEMRLMVCYLPQS